MEDEELTAARLYDDALVRAIDRVEALPVNRRGADKTWVEELQAAWDDACRSAVLL